MTVGREQLITSPESDDDNLPLADKLRIVADF